MARIIAWLILIFVVLLALRVIAWRKAGARRNVARESASQRSGVPMVRCARCGTFLPRAEAKQVRGDYICATGSCVAHG